MFEFFAHCFPTSQRLIIRPFRLHARQTFIVVRFFLFVCSLIRIDSFLQVPMYERTDKEVGLSRSYLKPNLVVAKKVKGVVRRQVVPDVNFAVTVDLSAAFASCVTK